MAHVARASLLGFLVLIAACGDDPAGPADYRAATPLQRSRALAAASGYTAGRLMYEVSELAQEPERGCPSITRAGDRVIIRGGCTTEDGWRFEGRIEARNLDRLRLRPIPADLDVTIDLDGFAASGPDGAGGSRSTGLDGHLAATSDGAQAAVRADLRIDEVGQTTILDGTWRFDLATRATHADPGSTVELDDLGVGEVTGTWTEGDPGSGAVELRGASVLRGDFSRQDWRGCLPLSVDGVEVEISCALDGE